MRLYLRLLRYLRPFIGRLVLALACMAFYAVTNFVSLGMIVPLMSVLFERPSAGSPVPSAPTITAPATATHSPHGIPVAAAQRLYDASLPWPEPLRSLG